MNRQDTKDAKKTAESVQSLTHHASLAARYWKDILWLLALAVYILMGTPLVPFHGDESTLIYMSRDYVYQFIERDLSKIAFSENPASPAEQELRLLNGTVNKYLYGLAWHLAGFTIDDLNEQWDWGADWNYNQQYGHAPSEALLLTARWPSALLTAAGIVALFALGWALGGRPAAYLASLYCALSPAILLNGRRAMMESAPLLFSLLTVLAAVVFLRRATWRRAALLGFAGGLALASKHTAVFTLGSAWTACGAYLLLPRSLALSPGWRGGDAAGSRRWGRAALLLMAGILAVAVFYLLNPAWWGANPFRVAGEVLDLRARILDAQIGGVGGYDGFLDGLAGFARQTLVALPQYYEVPNWAGFIGDQIARYEASPWRGVSAAALVGGGVPGALFIFGLAAAGLAVLARERRVAGSTRWVAGVWAAVMLASTLLLTPLEWQRYYLPAFPAVGLLAALGVVWLLRAAARRARSVRSGDPAGRA